jgi:hypothetical protein
MTSNGVAALVRGAKPLEFRPGRESLRGDWTVFLRQEDFGRIEVVDFKALTQELGFRQRHLDWCRNAGELPTTRVRAPQALQRFDAQRAMQSAEHRLDIGTKLHDAHSAAEAERRRTCLVMPNQCVDGRGGDVLFDERGDY